MVGSSQSIAGPNIVLNTIMAEILARYADELEQATDFDAALHALVCRSFTEHQRIIFNGNGYSKEWEEEAARRGLSNLKSTPESLAAYLDPKNIALFAKHGIFTENEFHARYEIHLGAYSKLIGIEARTSIDMVLHQILPAATAYTSALAASILSKESAGISCKAEKALATKLSDASDRLYDTCQALQEDLEKVPADSQEAACYYHNVVVARMNELRHWADILEKYTDKNYWPYPTYSDLLYY
jgi:glutamine synthetase